MKIQTVYFKIEGCYIVHVSKKSYAELKQSVKAYNNEIDETDGLENKLASKFRVTIDSNHKEVVAENILNQDFFNVFQTSLIFQQRVVYGI